MSDLLNDVDPLVRLAPETITQEQNGWDLAMQAAKLVPKEKAGSASTSSENVTDLLSMVEGKDAEKAVSRAKPLLKSYERSLSRLAQAVQKPFWRPPLPNSDEIPKYGEFGIEFPFPDFAALKTLAKALVLRARVALAEGHTDQASDDFLVAHLLGIRLTTGRGSLIQHLMGIALLAVSDRGIQRSMSSKAWTLQEIKSLKDGIANSGFDNALADCLRAEFNTFFLREIAGTPGQLKASIWETELRSPSLDEILKGHPRPFDRRATVRDASALFAQLIRTLDGPWSAQGDFEKSLESYTKSLPDLSFLDSEKKAPSKAKIESVRKEMLKLDNPVGKFMTAVLLPTFSQARESDRKSMADQCATYLILAVAMSRKTSGAEPPSLQSLVDQGHITAVPKDPFDDGPLKYDPVRRRIWSVGPDGKDDGGNDQPGSFMFSAKDYVWPSDGSFTVTGTR